MYFDPPKKNRETIIKKLKNTEGGRSYWLKFEAIILFKPCYAFRFLIGTTSMKAGG